MKGVKLMLEPTSVILARRGLDRGGRVQKYIDNEVLRRNAPYVPHATGTLQDSGRTATVIGSGEVVYNTPYARYLYYERLMVSPTTGSAWAKKNEKKVLTPVKLTYHGGGKRGGFHFERMKADHGKDILRNAANMAGGKAK